MNKYMAQKLIKRTNILFSVDQWQKLTQLAQERESSVGELVRAAVRRTYFSEVEGERMKATHEDFNVTSHAGER
jgi:hypothetical protein